MISFNRDMNRTATPAVSATRGADSIQQWVNVALAGNNNPLIASFNRDLYHAPVQGSHTAGLATDAFQQQFNIALHTESNPVMISFNRDMNHTATPAVSATRNADSMQQWVNIALAENNNALFANFTRVMGVELASVTNYQAILDQNMFLWNSDMITANA
jgi:hypothetical protein